MPGKVITKQSEAMTMVAARVMGKDTAIELEILKGDKYDELAKLGEMTKP